MSAHNGTGGLSCVETGDSQACHRGCLVPAEGGKLPQVASDGAVLWWLTTKIPHPMRMRDEVVPLTREQLAISATGLKRPAANPFDAKCFVRSIISDKYPPFGHKYQAWKPACESPELVPSRFSRVKPASTKSLVNSSISFKCPR